MKKLILLIFTILLANHYALSEKYWDIAPDGKGIVWLVEPDKPHTDHLEMAGKKVAAVLRYGVDGSRRFSIDKSLVWPCLRTVPNNTHASFMRRSTLDPVSAVYINGKPLKEQVNSIQFDGVLTVESDVYKDVILRRVYYTSVDRPMLVESHTFVNGGSNSVTVELPDMSCSTISDSDKGIDGSYCVSFSCKGNGFYNLQPGDSCTVYAFTQAHRVSQDDEFPDPVTELSHRRDLIACLTDNLQLETPDQTLNTMFHFSKIRSSESIYDTKAGPMHGPGGESYYAAIWANDQAEYVNPFFPFLGYDYANRSAENSFRMFAGYMNDDYKPIPSSIIAEGTSYWNGAGDRGDAAMIAYGAARYALASGDVNKARSLWPLITWCLQYCRDKIGDGGVVYSDCDELENRFPAGDANLCTSSLYYDALVSASYLAKICDPAQSGRSYTLQAKDMARNIESYFGQKVEGFDTYAYYKGNDRLRAWICIPMTMGIFDRAGQTTQALLSPKLWSENGLLSQSGETTYWDRATLYALRGIFAAGMQDDALRYLTDYSEARLLGEHVPYAIEAWPEGNQRHLSAESGLYARIYTEGLFGIRPTGLSSFQLTPQLPSDWDNMALRHIRLFGDDFDIEIKRLSADRLLACLIKDGKVMTEKKLKIGQTADIVLK